MAIKLLGKPFQIQTDHRALVWLDQLKEKNARLTRWSLSLQPYDFTVVHHRGKDNHNADVLSYYDCSAKNNSSQRNPEIFEQVEYGQTSLILEKGEECQRGNDFIT